MYLIFFQTHCPHPVIKDSHGIICSLPPIVNGEHSKLTLDTKNVLIEVTALDLTKARVVLDTVVTMFSRYCKQQFSCETLNVEYEFDSSRNAVFPDLEYRKTTVSRNYINNRLGVEQTADEIAKSLSKMGLCASSKKGEDEISVTVPPTRHDVFHACDIMEDAGIAYDFNKLPKKLPNTVSIGKQQQLEKLRNLQGGFARMSDLRAKNHVFRSKTPVFGQKAGFRPKTHLLGQN